MIKITNNKSAGGFYTSRFNLPPILLKGCYRFIDMVIFFAKPGLLINFVIILSLSPLTAMAGEISVAFFYGAPAPVQLLSQYDQVIVEPKNITPDELSEIRKGGADVFAYLSVGEVARIRPWYGEIDGDWAIGYNEGWDSDIMDLRNKEWHEYLVKKRLAAWWDLGYRAFFLDTMDSFNMVAETEEERKEQILGLANIIRLMHEKFPGIKLLYNRGFEVLPEVADLAVGFVAESLFYGWAPMEKKYIEMSKESQKWLLPMLLEVKNKYKLPVIVIDYIPPESNELARKDAKQIAELGFTPWIATPDLESLGVGFFENVPRRILYVCDSTEAVYLALSKAHRQGTMPLEYLGFAVDYLDVNGTLPGYNLSTRYAGIATWFMDNNLGDPTRYRDWLLNQIDNGMRVAIIGKMGFSPDPEFLQRLGLSSISPESVQKPLKIGLSDDLVGFESEPGKTISDIVLFKISGNDVHSHLRMEDQNGLGIDLVVTGPWGAIALGQSAYQVGFKDQLNWIINPFKFYSIAFNIKDRPVGDLTTEYGRRLLMVHIDGDGSANRAEIPGTPFSIQVIRDLILNKYKIPTTVSVVEGETGPEGLYPKFSPQLERAARDIYKLPHVEPASHTFSHPFDWKALEQGADSHLQIEGYEFNVERDINGSVKYINKRLTRPEKPVRVLLWSGNCLPWEEPVAMTKKLGLYNLNGGDTRVTYENPSLTEVSASGRPVGKYFQPYAPVINENVYTNNWLGPYYGFRKVIETFKITEAPRRLKPIGIYYHFYIGSKAAGLKSLEQVYDWALEQENYPLWVSEYAPKAEEAFSYTISRRLDGAWQISGTKELRTFRIKPEMGWPDFDRSPGVVSVRDIPQGRYVTFLEGQEPLILYLKNEPPDKPYIKQTNGKAKYWKHENNGVSFRVKGHVPILLQVAGTDKTCSINWPGGFLEAKKEKNTQEFLFPLKDTGDAKLNCG